MTSAEFAFWREAVLAALHAPETSYDDGVRPKDGNPLERITAVTRANEALEAYRENAAKRDAHHEEFVKKCQQAIDKLRENKTP
jgi:hypothetical protein